MPDNLPPPAILRKLLRYEPDTGKLFWLRRPREMFKSDRSAKIFAVRFEGKEALTASNEFGHKVGRIFNKMHRAHRVIWAMVYDEWPDGDIDHINGVGSDNRLHNLRDVEHKINLRNTKARKNNTSGHQGVSFDKKNQSWNAYITVDGRRKNLGYYQTIEAASAARIEAQAGHGFTERHGT